MLRGLFLVLAILLVVETEALPKVIKIGEYMTFNNVFYTNKVKPYAMCFFNGIY